MPLAEVLAAHPRIHAAEGAFYRGVFEHAAKAAGMAVTVIAPSSLDAKDARLLEVGRLVGRPWTADWKMAFLAALSGAS